MVWICQLCLTTCAFYACDMFIWYVCTNLSYILARHCAETCRGMNMQVVFRDFCGWCVYLGACVTDYGTCMLGVPCSTWYIHCVLWLTVLRWYIRPDTRHAYKQVTQTAPRHQFQKCNAPWLFIVNPSPIRQIISTHSHLSFGSCLVVTHHLFSKL